MIDSCLIVKCDGIDCTQQYMCDMFVTTKKEAMEEIRKIGWVTLPTCDSMGRASRKIFKTFCATCATTLPEEKHVPDVLEPLPES